VTYQEVLASMRRRDQIDSQRAHAPLRPAEDAIVIDTDGLDIEEVLARIEPMMRDP
jgi:cytidylate kinase